MGNPKQKWTSEEEEALKAGVAKHGTGKWKDIQRDPEFNQFLFTRSNIDLKDKWRNMSVASGQGPREKSRQPKAKANPDAPSAQLSTAQTSTATPVARDALSGPTVDDSSKGLSDAKTAAMYNAMIFEVLSTSKDQNGLDTSTIASFIEQRHEVPQNFRRLLSSRLRRLVAQDKLEKVQNCFKIKSEASLTKTPTMKQEDNQFGKVQNVSYVKVTDPIEDAAVSAAYKIAEAENKSFVAAEAIKEVERMSKMAEDTESMLLLAKEIFEKCNTKKLGSQGEVLC